MSKQSKREEVEQMFDAIAPRYDLLNHVLSFGIDKRWRRKVARRVASVKPEYVLDVATGTADLVIAMNRATGSGTKYQGVDISKEMVARGVQKLEKLGVDATLSIGDALNLEFEDGEFDALTCAFGVRNFEDIERGVSEMHRVLKSSAICCILEYSPQRRNTLWNRLFRFYFSHILPPIGRLVSGNKGAYTYLPKSVEGFYYEDEFIELLHRVGFQRAEAKSIMGGVVTLYTAYK